MSNPNGGASRSLSLKGVKLNERNKIEARKLIAKIKDDSIPLAFFDPQYRAGLDKLAFGNEGARQKGRAALPQMTDEKIIEIVQDIQRVLKPSGHMMFWIDKFALGSGMHIRYLRHSPALNVVDVIAWNKLRIGMGRRARCVTEYLIVAQKNPVRAKGCWSDHRIPDCWPEGKDADRHAHAKPHQLTERLIRSTTKIGDVVLDPCAGGYGVLTACLLSGRNFVGGDLL